MRPRVLPADDHVMVAEGLGRLIGEVADLRASTPTDAAKRVVPDVADEHARVQQARSRMLLRVTGMVGHEIERIGSLRSRPVLADPSRLITQRSEEVTRWVARGRDFSPLPRVNCAS